MNSTSAPVGTIKVTSGNVRVAAYLEQVRATVADFAAGLIPAILRTIQADCGFIGLFAAGSSEIVREVDVTYLGDNEEIEISDASFAERLLERQTVQDGSTLLVPLWAKPHVAGFLCVNRKDRRRHFIERDAEFLVAAARLLPHEREADAETLEIAGDSAEPMEWPIEPSSMVR